MAIVGTLTLFSMKEWSMAFHIKGKGTFISVRVARDDLIEDVLTGALAPKKFGTPLAARARASSFEG